MNHHTYERRAEYACDAKNTEDVSSEVFINSSPLKLKSHKWGDYGVRAARENQQSE